MASGELRPYDDYKPSGVEWLGDAPAHWEVRRLKNWLSFNRFTLPEDTNPDYTFDYLDVGSIETGKIVSKPKRMLFRDSPSRARRVVRSGDTIVSMVRTYLKAVWHAERVESDLIVSTGFAVLTPKPGTCPKYVSYVCQDQSFIERVTANSVGVAYPAIAETKLGTFEVGIPPLPEQTAIARFLDETLAGVDGAIDRARRQIALLREYRTRLIADAATGRIDVRAAAAALPDDGGDGPGDDTA